MKDLISQYQGTCHCGDVCFKIFTDSVFLDLYRCNCTLCMKKAIIMKPISEKFFFLLKGKNSLSSYKWNKKIAEHYFCSNCGVYTHHRRRRNPSQISINFACLNIPEKFPKLFVKTVNGLEHDWYVLNLLQVSFFISVI